MFYSQHIDYCFDTNLNGKGLPFAVYDSILSNTGSLINSLRQAYNNNSMPLLAALKNQNDLTIINETAKYITDHFDNLFVIAIGGSSLNSQVFSNFAYDNRSKIKINYINTVDPDFFDHIIRDINFKNAAFLIISKSGNSIETVAISISIINKIRQAFGNNYRFNRNFFFITDSYENPVRKLANDIQATIIDHSTLSGRFATLTNSGLLVAATLGLSPQEIREGACHTIENNLSDIASGASLIVGLLGYCYNINVLVTYQERFTKFNQWYAQIIAESLGKNGQGLTPMPVNGVFDQHGLFQLFLDGPQDKFFTFISYNTENTGSKIAYHDRHINITDKTLGDVNQQIQKTTIANIVKRNLPTRIFKIYKYDSATLGSLIMHFTLETIVTAKLLKVNPFNQPSIEEAKNQLKKILQAHS